MEQIRTPSTKDMRMDLAFLLNDNSAHSCIQVSDEQQNWNITVFRSVTHCSDRDPKYNSHSTISNKKGMAVAPQIKKKRRRILNKQRVVLNAAFHRNPFPSTAEKKMISKSVDMKLEHVHTWFQNKRAMLRRQAKQVGQRASFERRLQL